jgi:DNA-binding XRE family transcriptional regulator
LPKRQLKALDGAETFGQRLARLRKQAGFTQIDLAKDIGVTQRIITYYEAETQHPPTSLDHYRQSFKGHDRSIVGDGKGNRKEQAKGFASEKAFLPG